MLTAVIRQGGSGALISCVGHDRFGCLLRNTVGDIGIDAGGIQVTEKALPTLAFVSLDEMGDRSFSFYRKPGPDQLIQTKLLDTRYIDDCRIFHFGSLSLSRDPYLPSVLPFYSFLQCLGERIHSFDLLESRSSTHLTDLS